MKFRPTDPVRTYEVQGAGLSLTLMDCGRIDLQPNEQVSFTTANGREYDVTRKDWGFYATPSTNGRLKSFGFRTALVLSEAGKLFVMLVEAEQMATFHQYLEDDHQELLCWLDDDMEIAKLAAFMKKAGND